MEKLAFKANQGRKKRQERFQRLKTVLDEIDSWLDQAREIDRVCDNERAWFTLGRRDFLLKRKTFTRGR